MPGGSQGPALSRSSSYGAEVAMLVIRPTAVPRGRNARTSRCRVPTVREGGSAENDCSVNWAFVLSMLYAPPFFLHHSDRHLGHDQSRVGRSETRRDGRRHQTLAFRCGARLEHAIDPVLRTPGRQPTERMDFNATVRSRSPSPRGTKSHQVAKVIGRSLPSPPAKT
jgi:hypothetical protein